MSSPIIDVAKERRVIEWVEGWNYVQPGITKLKRILEGLPETQFTADEYINFYTAIFLMCTQSRPDPCQQLYEKYHETFVEYITWTVLPSLRQKQDVSLLQEFVKRWENHKYMVLWMSRWFQYLDRYFIHRKGLTGLNEVGFNNFHDLVYREVNAKVRSAVIVLINKERDGEEIDRLLLKNVVDIFVDIGRGQMDVYERDFEAYMVKDTGEYYSRMASSWIMEDISYGDYMRNAEECLRRERGRVSHYMHPCSEKKVVEMVKQELVVYATQLTPEEISGDGSMAFVEGDDDVMVDLSAKLVAKVVLEPRFP